MFCIKIFTDKCQVIYDTSHTRSCDVYDKRCRSLATKKSYYCKNHKCIILKCTNRKSEGLCACEKHMCRDTGCKKNIKLFESEYGKYCEKHSCEYYNCFDHSMTNFKYCKKHKCVLDDCINKRNEYKKSEFCTDHACNIEECGLRKYESDYCKNHKCDTYRCSQNSQGSFCYYHKCYYGFCAGSKGFNGYCYDHSHGNNNDINNEDKSMRQKFNTYENTRDKITNKITNNYIKKTEIICQNVQI